MIKSESIAKLAASLVKAQREMSNAKKDAKNPFFKSVYADLNSVREAVTPALHDQGISVLQLNLHENGKNFVRTTLLHESGEYICSDTEIVVKEASNPQALGSAISYARRYGLSSMLSVGAQDDDGEGGMGRQSFTVSKASTAPAQTTATPAKSPNPFAPAPAAPKQETFNPASSFRKK